MSEVNLEIDVSDLETKLEQVNKIPNGTVKVLKRTLNRTVKGMKTDALSEITANYTAKRKKVSNTLFIIKATKLGDELSAILRSNGRPMRLINSKHRKNRKPGKKGAATAFANPKKASGGGYTGGFVASVKAGSKDSKGIFVRTGDKKEAVKGNYKGQKRETIKQLHGPGAVQMLNNDNVKEGINKKTLERFKKELDHEINYLLTQEG